MTPTILDEPPEELADVRAGKLPARYGYRMQDVFLRRLRPLLRPGISILDVGAGRAPTIASSDRPARTRYVGLDVSAREIESAGSGAYDKAVIHDITQPIPGDERFDLAISWQVLEHVAPLDSALENLRSALHPGGTLLAQLSGSFALFSLAARIMPHRVRVAAMSRLLGHSEDLKFPTQYDRCHARALAGMLQSWSSVEIVCFYRGAVYLDPFRLLQRAYLSYENAAAHMQLRDLATHYLIIARR